MLHIVLTTLPGLSICVLLTHLFYLYFRLNIGIVKWRLCQTQRMESSEFILTLNINISESIQAGSIYSTILHRNLENS